MKLVSRLYVLFDNSLYIVITWNIFTYFWVLWTEDDESWCRWKVCVCVCAACCTVTMATQTNTGNWCGMLQQVIISSKPTFDPYHALDDIWLHLPAVTESLGRVTRCDVTCSACYICFLWCCRLTDAGVQLYTHNMIFKKQRCSLCFQRIKRNVSQRYRVCVCYLR